MSNEFVTMKERYQGNERVMGQIEDAANRAGMVAPEVKNYVRERRAILELLRNAAKIIDGTLSAASCALLDLPAPDGVGAELADWVRKADRMGE